MGRKGIKIVVTVVLIFFFGGCATYDPGTDSGLNIKGSAPKFAKISYEDQKAAIRQVILKATKDFNERNAEAFLKCYSEDAQIMVVIGREPEFVSKATCAKMFPAEFDKVGKAKYESLSIKVLDAKTAKTEGVVSISKGFGEDLVWTKKKLDLINQNGEWLVVRSTIDIYYRGDSDPRDRFRPVSPGDALK